MQISILKNVKLKEKMIYSKLKVNYRHFSAF